MRQLARKRNTKEKANVREIVAEPVAAPPPAAPKRVGRPPSGKPPNPKFAHLRTMYGTQPS